MGRNRSGHGGSNPLSDVVAACQWVKNFARAVEALDPEHPETHSSPDGQYPQFTRENMIEIKTKLGRVRSSLAVIDTLAQAIEAYADVDLSVEAANAKVQEAEQRLSQIDTSVRAKMEHMALLLKKEEEIDARLLEKKRELAKVEAGIAEYRAAIARL